MRSLPMADEKTVPFGTRDVAPEEKAPLVGDVFRSVATSYDVMNDLMSGGMHRVWKSVTIDRMNPQPGHSLIDVAGGTGDIAASFNSHFGEVFTLPKPKILEETGRVPGTDGEKMSKSYGNTIELFDEPKPMRKKIMRIATDSRPMEDPKDPEGDHLFDLFKLFGSTQQVEEMAALYRRGNFGYGEVKKALADAADAFFEEPRARRAELEADPKRLQEILGDGAQQARAKARETLRRAQAACGLPT